MSSEPLRSVAKAIHACVALGAERAVPAASSNGMLSSATARVLARAAERALGLRPLEATPWWRGRLPALSGRPSLVKDVPSTHLGGRRLDYEPPPSSARTRPVATGRKVARP